MITQTLSDTNFMWYMEFISSFPLCMPIIIMGISLKLSFLFCLLGVIGSVHFQIQRFSPEKTNKLYQRDAVHSARAFELSNNRMFQSNVGQAMYADQTMQIWDFSSCTRTRKCSSFSTHFNYTNDTQSRSNHGSGLAFLLAPAEFQFPLNSSDKFLGLHNTSNSNSPEYQIVAADFDPSTNPKRVPLNEHVQNNNSIFSSFKTFWNISSQICGNTAGMWVPASAPFKTQFAFYFKENPNSLRNSSPSNLINIRKALLEVKTIANSATTGQYTDLGTRATFKSWNCSSTLSLNNTSRCTKKAKIIVTLNTSSAVTVAVFLSLTILLIIVWYRRRSWTAKKAAEAANNLEVFGPRKFSYQYLAVATNDFSNEQKLGEGGFGCVYKGYLTDLEIHIAVKKISSGSRQGKKEYLTEVNIISRLRHRHILQLIGCCHDQGQFLLVYEYMPNRSLDVHLFGNTSSLVWQVRYKITLGLASALHYLQEECEQSVVHRDIKSSNIMLDSNFDLKLGDFGLAKLLTGNELVLQTTGLAGTFGYMAPEYVNSGIASKGSDIYSFGMVILEIVTGRRSRDTPDNGESERGLLEWVWNLYGSAELLSAVDGKLNTEFDARQVECLLIVGLWCAHPDQNLRPSIRKAIQALNFEVAMPILPTEMPVPIYHVPLSMPSASSSEASMTFTSINVGR